MWLSWQIAVRSAVCRKTVVFVAWAAGREDHPLATVAALSIVPQNWSTKSAYQIHRHEVGFMVQLRQRIEEEGNASMHVGYARVSTTEQNLDLQIDALTVAGCERLFTDTVSGGHVDRPGLAAALRECRSGDTLIVWKLDRLGRSLPHLVETVRDLGTRGVGFKCVQENIDTTTSGGKLIFHIFASLAEFERDLIRERTTAGLTAARARGRTGGRPKGVDQKKQKATPRHLIGDVSVLFSLARFRRPQHAVQA